MLQVWPYKDKKRKEKKRKGTCEHTTSRLFKWAPKAQDPVASHMGLRSRPRFRTCRRVTLWDRGPRGEGPGWRETQPSCCPAGAGPAPGLRCRLPIQEGAPWPARAESALRPQDVALNGQGSAAPQPSAVTSCPEGTPPRHTPCSSLSCCPALRSACRGPFSALRSQSSARAASWQRAG